MEGLTAQLQYMAMTKQNEVLNLYSKRHYNVDKELFAKFEEENNIKGSSLPLSTALYFSAKK